MPSTVERWQNMANLVVCSIVAYHVYQYHYAIPGQKDPAYLNQCVPVVLAHFVTDFFLAKPDIQLHHALGILIIAFKYFYRVPHEHDRRIILALYETEYSTVFYVIKFLLKDDGLVRGRRFPALATLNDLVFAATFLYYRIYKYYYGVIRSPEQYAIIASYTEQSWVNSVIIYASVHGMFVLNMYWACLILKMACYPWWGRKNASYTRWLHVNHRWSTWPWSVWTFINQLQWWNYAHVDATRIYALLGNYFYMGTAHLYHSLQADYWMNTWQLPEDTAPPMLIVSYVLRQVGFHLYSYGTLVSCLMTSPLGHEPHYTLRLMQLSAIIHICSMACHGMSTWYYIHTCGKIVNYALLYGVDNAVMYQSYPFLVDTSIVVYHLADPMYAMDVAYVSIASVFVLYIQPGGAMHDVGFQSLMLLRYYMLGSLLGRGPDVRLQLQ